MSADLARGLYTAEDYSRAADTIRRIGNCHEYRLASEISARPGRAVAAARLAVDLVETATIAELRAMVVQLTTPELRPAVPVVVANVPVGSVNPSTEKVGGLAAPTPPALDHVMDLVATYGTARAHWDLGVIGPEAVDAANAAVRAAVERLALGAPAEASEPHWMYCSYCYSAQRYNSRHCRSDGTCCAPGTTALPESAGGAS